VNALALCSIVDGEVNYEGTTVYDDQQTVDTIDEKTDEHEPVEEEPPEQDHDMDRFEANERAAGRWGRRQYG
jgi:hypothetical protein